MSLLQDHVLKAILKFFPERGWMVRIARCIEAEKKSAEEGESSGLPVFIVICTKMVKMPNFSPVCALISEMELHILCLLKFEQNFIVVFSLTKIGFGASSQHRGEGRTV